MNQNFNVISDTLYIQINQIDIISAIKGGISTIVLEDGRSIDVNYEDALLAIQKMKDE